MNFCVRDNSKPWNRSLFYNSRDPAMKKDSDVAGLNLVYFKERSLVVFTLVWGIILLCLLLLFTESPQSVWSRRHKTELSMSRDVYTQDSWPGVEANVSSPLHAYSSVHFYWCGKKIFRFEDYLGLLSVVRVLRPQSLVFHYNNLPLTDDNLYHTWFLELTQSLPNLVLRHTPSNLPCGSRDALAFGLRQLAREGGVYVGERTLLTRQPEEAWSTEIYSHSFRRVDLTHEVSQGIVFSRTGFPVENVEDLVDKIITSSSTCYTADEFEKLTDESMLQVNTTPCIVLTESLYPKDIWNGTTRFAELARWMFYGQRNRMVVQKEANDVIPRVSHVVWLRENRSEEFQFLHYLSILSAIHVAGFDRVFVHGQEKPTGAWWDRLQDENVTFIKVPRQSSVFQKDVRDVAHQSTLIRLYTLLKYGGACQDIDVIWVSKLPDDLRRYPTVMNLDWARHGEFPGVVNMGVVLAKPNAGWLKYFIQTLNYYRESHWEFNIKLMPYKVYERHPDQIHIDKYLQVVCYQGICHPTWLTDFQREIDDFQPIINYDWRDARAFHFIVPKPPSSLLSPAAIKENFGMFSDMGRAILAKSGQTELIN